MPQSLASDFRRRLWLTSLRFAVTAVTRLGMICPRADGVVGCAVTLSNRITQSAGQYVQTMHDIVFSHRTFRFSAFSNLLAAQGLSLFRFRVTK